MIRREDHKSDSLGAIFLGATRGADAILAAVERYLGRDRKVLVIDEAAEALRVEVESTSFVEESANLVRLAKASSEKGWGRGAAEMFREALRLDPLNAEALRGQAEHHMEHGDGSAAEAEWILAAEIIGFDARTLRSLAIIALAQERRPTAMRYLEEALQADPADKRAADLMAELRKQLEIRFAEVGLERPAQTNEE